jgi:glycerophosphoryl diester phosphodiesterase
MELFAVVKQHPIIIAHRGASGLAPENTMAAFRRAVELGADWIELDVHQTSDNRIVVLHDFTLRRTARDPRPVKALSLGEIRKLDAGGWWDKTFRGQRVPTLEEVLEFARGRIRIQIELKRGSPFYPGIEKRLSEILNRPSAGGRAAVSSFDAAALETLRGIDSGLALGLLTRRTRPNDIVKEAMRLKVQSVHVSTHRLTRRLLVRCHENGLPVYVYTVNRRSLMKRYLSMGVDGLFTNYPDRMRDLIRSLNLLG